MLKKIEEDKKKEIEDSFKRSKEDYGYIISEVEDRFNYKLEISEKQVADSVWEKMKKVTDDIESILKSKQRERSDLLVMNAKLVAGVE